MEKIKTRLEAFIDGLDIYVDKVKSSLKADLEGKRKVVIFGAGEGGRQLYEKFSQDGAITVVAFVDSFKFGKFCGLDVLRPERLKDLEFDYICIASSRKNEIVTTLVDVGVRLNKIDAPFSMKLGISLTRPLRILKKPLETWLLKNLLEKEETMKRILRQYSSRDIVLGKRLCKANSKFKDIHAGERCFILGNGPSLRDVDLSLLADEFVFSCNRFSKIKDYKKAKTNIHVWADPAFFGLYDANKLEEEALWANYRAIAEEAPLCFVPVFAHDFVCKNKLEHLLNINYLFDLIPILLTPFQDISYDLCAPVSRAYCVVQEAIIIALYMGFKEIYLLGCDETTIIPYIETLLKQDISVSHAYDDDPLAELIKMQMKHYSISDKFCLQYGLFFAYKKFNDLCLKKGVKLINCSSRTIITEIPRMDLSEVLGNQNERK